MPSDSTRTTRRGRPPLAILLAAWASLLVAGCADREPVVTPAEYVAAADALCAQARDAAAGLTPPRTTAEEITYRRAVLEIGRDQLGALRGLGVPPELRERHGRALAALDEQQDLLDQLLQRRIDGAAGTADLEAAITAREIEMNAAARALGLTVCGRESPGAILAGGPEHRAWREQYLTALDGALLFADTLGSAPPLAELATADHELVAEANALIAALARLGELEPPASARGSHAFMVDAVPPLAALWMEVARAAAAGDRVSYDAALAAIDGQAAVIARLEASVAG